MDQLFRQFPFVKVYLDDIIVFSATAELHASHVKQVIQTLKEAGFTLNYKKCYFGCSSINYLGFEVSTQGISSSKGAIEKLTKLLNTEPKTHRQLRSLLGSLNFFRLLVPAYSARLAQVTNLLSQKSFVWTQEHHQAVTSIIQDVTQGSSISHVKLGYPFIIYTDASDYGIGSVVTQDDKPIYFYSKKLNSAQANYTVSEKEALAIVLTLQHLKHILLGSPILIKTDHSNLQFLSTAKLQRIQRWKLLIDEFDVTIEHIPGHTNSLADFLSRQVDSLSLLSYPLDTSILLSSQENDQDCQNVIASSQVSSFPLPVLRSNLKISNNQVLHKNWNSIYVPDKELQKSILKWAHQFFYHPGIIKLFGTLRMHVWWPSLKKDIEHLVQNCRVCQTLKNSSVKYGKLSLPDQVTDPFSRIHIDLVGPIIFDDSQWENNEMHEFKFVLTMVDATTRWVEFVALSSTESSDIIQALTDHWFTRYPKPKELVSDNGPQFISDSFKSFLQSRGVKHILTTTYNPQSNALIERIHGTLNSYIRQVGISWPSRLQEMAYVFRSTFHRVLQCSPGNLVFDRDMLDSIRKIDRNAIMQAAAKFTQLQKDSDIARQNQTRLNYTYSVGDRILIAHPSPNKTTPRFLGPVTVSQVFPNNTLSYITSDGFHRRINLRRVKPFGKAV